MPTTLPRAWAFVFPGSDAGANQVRRPSHSSIARGGIMSNRVTARFYVREVKRFATSVSQANG